VVAEGVEELGDLHALGDFPREWAQGYHLARPLDANAMRDFLDVRRFQMAPPAGARVIRLPLRSQAS
jgi:EAL domain-containing protein (putative c-di-GMP-specific phosphodiesterase class I)